jgi:hypothetical protein
MVLDMGKLAVLAALAASQALAASDQAVIENTFVKPWVAAIRSGDKAKVELFFHPATRACINPESKLFFDTMVERQTAPGETGNSGFFISGLHPMKGPVPAYLPADEFTYPVEPSYQVDVQFENTDLVMSLFLAQSNGSWYEVFPCPNEKGMVSFRKELVEIAETKKKTAQTLAELKDPLRSELKELLRQDKRVDAIEKYKAAANVDTGTAMRVIDALQRSKP